MVNLTTHFTAGGLQLPVLEPQGLLCPQLLLSEAQCTQLVHFIDVSFRHTWLPFILILEHTMCVEGCLDFID